MSDSINTAMSPLLLTAEQVAQTLGVSLRHVRALDATGRLPRGVRLSRSKRWRAEELRAWTDAGCPPRDCWTWPQSSPT